jgi:hypothetical protein
MFRKAQRKKAKLRLGILGPAGSGKTYTALLIAQGLGGHVAMIDTEHGSGELYSHIMDYDVATLTPPFTPQRYVELIKEAEKAEYSNLIIDSLSHAWQGEGGVLDMHDKASSATRNSFTAWREVTPHHNNLVETMLQSSLHIIATMRTKTAYEVVEENGKAKPVKVGLAPVQREGMDYEFTVVFELSIDKHIATASKDRTGLFDGQYFVPSIETGKTLLDWLETGEDPTKISETSLNQFLERVGTIENVFELQNWWKKHKAEFDLLLPVHRSTLVDAVNSLKATLGDGRQAVLN